MANKNNAYLPNLEPFFAMGIDPRTGLPLKFMSGDKCNLKDDIKRDILIQDRQDAINRYTWYNLPDDIDGNLIERMLYYKGQGAFFYMPTIERFFFLPFAMAGSPDVYGRMQKITPVAFGNGSVDNEGKQKPWINGLEFNVAQDIYLEEELTEDLLDSTAVILWDYSKGIGEYIEPRASLQQAVIDTMAECIPMMRTSLINSTGVSGMQVQTEDDASNVYAANQGIMNASLTGKRFIPIVGTTPFQDFNNGAGTAQANEFLMTYQSLNNLRLGNYGLSSGSVFQKLGSTLQSESDMNLGNQQHISDDGLYQRQKFCNIVNSIWGLGIWCEVNTPDEVDGINENSADAMQAEGDTINEENTTINTGGEDYE